MITNHWLAPSCPQLPFHDKNSFLFMSFFGLHPHSMSAFSFQIYFGVYKFKKTFMILFLSLLQLYFMFFLFTNRFLFPVDSIKTELIIAGWANLYLNKIENFYCELGRACKDIRFTQCARCFFKLFFRHITVCNYFVKSLKVHF